MVSKWAQGFYDSLDSKLMGFDGLGKLEKEAENEAIIDKKKSKREKEKERLKFRMRELAARISDHARIAATLSLPSSYLAWNKNLQCPSKTWDDLLSNKGQVIYKECKADIHKQICVKWYNTETYNFVSCFCEDPEPKEWKPRDKNRPRAWESTSNQKSLILPRHNPYEKSLEIADYVGSYFPSQWRNVAIAYEGNKGETKYGFMLINEYDAPFVYAILKSSMFRAWCELTAYTDKWTDKKGHNHQGAGHFAVGMWDTFPLPYLSPCNEKFIIGAAKDKNWDQLNVLIDKLFVPGISNPLADSRRLQILAEGFRIMFPSLENDVTSLALTPTPKP